jgi:cytochrome c2
MSHHPHDSAAHHPRHAGRWIVGAIVAAAVYFAGLAVHDRVQEASDIAIDARHLAGGDPARGAALARMHGCAFCHTIPGIPGSRGAVGPSLEGFASRMYVGGAAVNSPDNLVQWIVDPKSLDSNTAMPMVGVTTQEARHLAAYLYTLR